VADGVALNVTALGAPRGITTHAASELEWRGAAVNVVLRCPRWTNSGTLSETLVVAEAEGGGAASGLLQGSAVAAAVIGATAAAFGGALQLQLLGGLLTMPCAAPALQESAGPMRYLVSPLYDLGWEAVVLGNVGIAAACALLQCGAAALLCYLHRVPSVSHGLVEAHFPSLSFAVGQFLFQGACRGSIALLSSGGAGAVLGAAGVVVTVAFVASTVYVLRRRTGSLRMAAYDFPRRYGTAALWLLPCGRWGPELARKAFGRYVSRVGARHKPVAAVPLLQAAVVGVLSAFGGPLAACVAQWAVLAVVFALAALLYAVRAPLRVPAWGVLEALTSGVLSIVAAANALASGGGVSAASVVETTAALTVVATLLSALLNVHVVAIDALELLLWGPSRRPRGPRLSVMGGTVLPGTAACGASPHSEEERLLRLAAIIRYITGDAGL
jgi:hypothetical protein